MDAATIEQMNKVRASVGLPLLPVPGKAAGPQFKTADESGDEGSEEDISTLDKRQALADSNWQKLENERLERLERQKRKDAAKKAREVQARSAKLDGKGLGEEDEGGDLDTRSWLVQQKKRQKKIEQARKLEAELLERERDMQAQYTSKDLAGVKVGHELDDFDGMTEEKILTLKDAAIGEESEDDELENQDLKEQERLNERLQLKKKRPDYDPTEQGEVKGILSKYDEEIDGRKQKRFKLDGHGTSVEAAQRRQETEERRPANKVKINLDMLQDDAPVNDYLEAKIKVKKPKKTKEKKTRHKAVDEDDIVPVQPAADSMDIDGAPSKKRGLDLDDDDLQAQLAEQRRQTLKKRKKMDAAELARQMRDEMPVDDEPVEEGGMVIDETSEFVANLNRAPDSDDEDQKPRAERHEPTTAMDVDSAESPQAEAPPEAALITSTGLEDEESMAGRGLAGTMALLRKRGLIEDKDAARKAEKEQQRRQFLAEKQDLIDSFDQRAKQQREADRQSGKLDRMSNREREAYGAKQNEAREAYLAKLQAEMFNKNYKPDVKLEYHDEFGRTMNQKEAFKHLSHSFHGKASGKQKTEKRLKKIADEQREMSKGLLNANEQTGMSYIQGREGKRTKQAGVRLQ